MSRTSRDCPATPAPPRFTSTRLYAYQIRRVGTSNGFAPATGSSSFELACCCGRTARRLRSARITGPNRYYTSIRPSAPHRYSPPRGSSTCGFSLGIGAVGSHVPHESLDRARAAFMPAATWAGDRHPPGFIPGQRLDPGFDGIPMLSTRHQRFTRVRLSGPHLMESRPTFSDSLTTTAIGPPPQPVVWNPPLLAGPEGPTLISRAARLLQVGLYILASSLRPRGAPSSACLRKWPRVQKTVGRAHRCRCRCRHVLALGASSRLEYWNFKYPTASKSNLIDARVAIFR